MRAFSSPPGRQPAGGAAADGPVPDRPPQAPSVPGFLLAEQLGRGASGQVWRAAPTEPRPDLPAEVAIKVVAVGAQADREVAALEAVRHPHVLSLLAAVPLDDHRLALVTPVLAGGTLAGVVAARGQLEPGEVVTVVAPLASAVAALHARGVQHGDVAASNVLFDGSGRPWLTDLGTVRITGEPRAEVFGTAGYVDPVVLAGGAPGPASDVYGLGALAWFALCGSPPAPPPCRPSLADQRPGLPADLVAVVEAAIDPDPLRRPGPAQLAAGLRSACPGRPVWRAGLAPSDGGLTRRIRQLAAEAAEPAGSAHGRHRRPGRWRPTATGRRLACGAAVAAVLLAGVLTLTLGHGVTRTNPPAPVAAGAGGPVLRGGQAGETGQVVAGLARQRALALARGYGATGAAPGTAAWAADAATLHALAGRGLRYHGLTITTRDAALRAATPGRAEVDVVTDTSAYLVVDRSGQVLQRVPARPGVRSRLVLVATAQGWRVASTGSRVRPSPTARLR